MIKNPINKKYRILCIDDSRLNRAFIIKILTPLNITVDEAENGIAGLEMISRNSYDLILLDIIMPEMDGFGFLKEFSRDKREQFIPVILMTGLDDLNAKIKGLSTGADDYLLKPLNEQELIARVFSLLRLKNANSELFEKNMLIKKELEAAKKIQRYIIPSEFSFMDYPSVSGVYKPIEDIGGDFFDCYKIDENRSAFVIADVTGHGIPAALTMTMAKMLFSISAPKFRGADELMKEINRQMKSALLDTQYVTAFYLIYDKNSGKLSYSNAGHTRALFYREGKNQVLALDSFGWFIGISDECEYEEKSVNVAAGDRLFIYTDGITEAKNSSGEEFGEVRLAKFIRDRNGIKGEEFCTELMKILNSFIEKTPVNDDIAFLNIEF
ncbi:MAG TPA: fused response regulator/phosphatase [Spirochaetota bacterium]|nr:fused response regulator/phosphatase [Spirochaetota bacterium]HPF05657.1 fused response regulator/phosphatase [Spirochaetota bacterium]HPJ42242.1 fused response regulator/phosphatase [Spirochaetota bacterium]HPR36751.1 fused response regulator/phosphatase [Spirochaetota bacterium]HRX47056.1 fused response regulator/phosphatase [Spirochaetota bacterium]